MRRRDDRNMAEKLAGLLLGIILLCFGFLLWWPLLVYSVRYWHG